MIGRSRRWRLASAATAVAAAATAAAVGAVLAGAGDVRTKTFLRDVGLLGKPDMQPCQPATGSRVRGALPGAGNWRRERSFSRAQDQMFAAATARGLLVGGGVVEDGPNLRSSDRVYWFDPESGVTPAASLPRPLDHAAAVVHDGAVYVAGGFSNGVARRELWRYEPSRNRWTELAPMEVARGAAGAAVIGGRLYVVGGASNAGVWIDDEARRDLEVYDLRTGRWSRRAPMPTDRHHLGVAAHAGFLYVIGGRRARDFATAAVERYDPATDTWERLPSLPQGAGGVAAVAAGDEVIAIGGGDDDVGWVTPATWALDARDLQWRRLPDLNVPRHSHAAVLSGSRVYVIAGSPCAGFGRTPVVESLALPGR